MWPSTPSGGSWPRRLAFALLPLALLPGTAELALRAAGWQGQPDREVSWCREHTPPARPFLPAMKLDGRRTRYTPRVGARSPWYLSRLEVRH